MIIQSKKVWVNECLKPMQIEIKDGKFTDIHEYNSKSTDEDYGDLMILPGFLDIHCHGYDGVNANIPTAESLKKWMKHMPAEGVTSFLVTTSTQSYDKNVTALKTISELYDKTDFGAEILGINIEGNFISHEYRGAQDPYTIIPPQPELLREYNELSKGRIKTVTCAIEKDKDFAFCDTANKMGIPVSIGHSGAKYEVIAEAVNHGLKGVTHTGNAMLGIHHREPGTFGAAMVLDELFAEVVGDGVHIHFEIVKMIGRMKGKDKLILVTDSSVYKEYKREERIEGKTDVEEKNGSFVNKDGRLSGSSLRVNMGIYNLVYKAGLPLETAINAATINPAKYIGEDHRKGSIEIGKDADLAICNEEFQVLKTYVMGNVFIPIPLSII